MAIWVCRTGGAGEHEDSIRVNNQIYFTRSGYHFNLAQSDKESIILLTKSIYAGSPRQTISNIWSQADIFVNRMQVGDLVIVPKKGKYEISVARVVGEYKYNMNAPELMQHQRDVIFLKHGIDTTNFPQDIFYSLGAFRALFSIKQEDRMLALLRKVGVDV